MYITNLSLNWCVKQIETEQHILWHNYSVVMLLERSDSQPLRITKFCLNWCVKQIETEQRVLWHNYSVVMLLERRDSQQTGVLNR